MTGVVEAVVAERSEVPRAGPRRSGPAVRLAARLARREMRRRPGRTLLVALLVAGPVAAMVVVPVLVRTNDYDAARSWRQLYGSADAMVVVRDRPLPPELRSVPATEQQRVLRTTAGTRIQARVLELPMTDPLTAGMVRIDEGRAPAHADEVFLSPSVADHLGAGIGSELALEQPAPLKATVTGLGVLTQDIAAHLVVLGPHRHLPPLHDCRCELRLVDLPDDITPEQQRTRARELSLRTRSDFTEAGRPPGDNIFSALVLLWVGGAVTLTVAAIVIAAAFAAGARRQSVTLDLLAANGAPPRLLRRVVALQGLLTGAVGSMIGVGLAGVILLTGRPRIMTIFGSARDAYVWSPVDVAAAVILGLLVATVAAAVPGRTVPTGRRRRGRVSARLTGAGTMALSGGCALLMASVAGYGLEVGPELAWAVIGAAGGVILLLGMCAFTPAIVSHLERGADRLPAPWRRAARSLGRQRTHTAALIAAVCATAALTLAASGWVTAARAEPALAPMALDQVHIRALGGGRGDGNSTLHPVAVPDEVVDRVTERRQLTAADPIAPAHSLTEISERGHRLTPVGRDRHRAGTVGAHGRPVHAH